MTAELKVCSKCHLELPVVKFSVVEKASSRRRAHCNDCESARVRAFYAANPGYRAKTKANSVKWRDANPEKTAKIQRRAMLKSKYGISHEQFDQLFAAQDSQCALCGKTEHGRTQNGERIWLSDSWPIDHNHVTGAVRGILCHTCNTQLGGYETLINRVGEVRLLDYLTRPSPVLALPAVPAVVDLRSTARFVAELPPRYTRGQCTVCGHDQHAGGFCFRHYMRARRRDGDAGPAGELPRGLIRGEGHHKSTLSESQAREIRCSTEKGVDLARRFNVNPSVISSIRKGHTWKHLAEEGQ